MLTGLWSQFPPHFSETNAEPYNLTIDTWTKTQDLNSSVLLINQGLNADSVEIEHHPLTLPALFQHSTYSSWSS